MSRLLLGCIADDFTGACDLANNLVRSGLRTVLMLGVPAARLGADSDTDTDAVVIALKSRTTPSAWAVEQSLAALRRLRADGAEQIYFKYCSTFDSTPQGNIGPVIDALLDELHGPGEGFTIACPAFPENQRTVFNGHLFVGEQLLSDSGMRHHPLTPMTNANLVPVLQAQSRRRVGLVGHRFVAQGAQAVAGRFAALRDEGIGIAVVDAICDDDLLSIGAALAGMPLVSAASGIALGLAQNWPSAGGTKHGSRLPPATGLRAIVSGSCSVATNAQVKNSKERGLPCFGIDPVALAAGSNLVQTALDWARQSYREQPDRPVLLYATAHPEQVLAAQQTLGTGRAGELVETALSRIAVGLVDLGVRQLVVAGGETSGAVVQSLGVQQLTIGPQIEPGVPWTTARASACEAGNLHLALKSGNFGSVDFFSKAFERLDSLQ